MHNYFKKNFLYLHKNNTDVAFAPLKVFYVPQKKYYKLKVEWYNIVHDPCSLLIKQNIVIPEKDILDWQLYYNLNWARCLLVETKEEIKIKVIGEKELITLRKN